MRRNTQNFPQEVYQRLVAVAEASQRSFSGEVVWLVRAGLAEEEERVKNALKIARRVPSPFRVWGSPAAGGKTPLRRSPGSPV